MWNDVCAQTILQPGDLAVIGYNFKDPDQFSFILLNDLDPGTVIYITDCGYDNASAAFREGEGYLTYTVPVGGQKAGSVITYPDDAGFVKHGVSGFFGLSVDGDQLIFFQGTFLTPTFIYALSVNDQPGWQTGSIDNNTSSLPPGLTDGVTALKQSKMVNSKLDCTGVALDKALFLTQITDEAKWIRSNTTRVTLPDITCNYTVLALKPHVTYVDIPAFQNTILHSGYLQIDVYDITGTYYFTAISFAEASDKIIREKLYIFKVYYPDHLEVVKIILEK